jgi:hypothetical protein
MKNELINYFKENNIEIWAISGKISCGKNYIGEKILYPMLPSKETMFVSLADHFKIDVISKDGVAYERVYHKKDDESRRKLQLRGTEEGRNIYGEDIWVNTLLTWMRVHAERGINRFILSDLRFWNEFKTFKDLGATTIRIIAPERNREAILRESKGDKVMFDKISTHPSEIELDKHIDEFDYVVYNDFKDEKTVPSQVSLIVQNHVEETKPNCVILCDLDDNLSFCGKYYQEIILKVKNYISDRYYNDNDTYDFSKIYDFHILQHHSDTYYKTPFHKNQFPDSLVSVYKKMMDVMGCTIKEGEIQEIYNWGMEIFDVIYEPMEHIHLLSELEKHGKIVLYTKGDHDVQIKKIVSLGLTKYDREIVTMKTPDILHNIIKKYPAHKHIVIGDSFLNDIAPALEIGIDGYHYTNKPNVNHPNYKWVSSFEQILEDLLVKTTSNQVEVI